MNEYQAEDVRLRVLYAKSLGVTGADAIREKTGCSRDDAWRLACVRDIASGILLEQWTSGALRWRRLWRIATDNPLNQGAQLRAAAERTKRAVKKGLRDKADLVVDAAAVASPLSR